jgi:hypothetical protein
LITGIGVQSAQKQYNKQDCRRDDLDAEAIARKAMAIAAAARIILSQLLDCRSDHGGPISQARPCGHRSHGVGL